MENIRVLSYNIHKGFSGGLRRGTLVAIREELRRFGPDVIFLQEVYGEHRRYLNAGISQYEYLAHEIWPHFRYGQNAVYEEGHHGNAILSKFPILQAENFDISTNRLERRGLLRAEVRLPGDQKLSLFCTHLNLSEESRQRQLREVERLITLRVPGTAPLIVAGDFNDWRQRAHEFLRERLGLHEAFRQRVGRAARTFPSFFPSLALDRIYIRGLQCQAARCLSAKPWPFLSDHLPLTAELLWNEKESGDSTLSFSEERHFP